MRDYKKEERRQKKQKQKSNDQIVNKILTEIHNMEQKVEKCKDWTYISSDGETDDEDYSDDSDYDRRRPKKAKVARNLDKELEELKKESQELDEELKLQEN